MSDEKEILEYPMHKHIDENGNVYWHSHAPGQHVDADHEHYHVDELGNLYSHVHDHADPVYVAGLNSPEYVRINDEHDEHHHHYDHCEDKAPEEAVTPPSEGSVHTQTKAVINRLSRAIGHLESVKRMVENGRDCTEVLIQLAAVRSALSSTAKVILKDHLEHCISEVEPGNPDQFKALNDAIDRFM